MNVYVQVSPDFTFESYLEYIGDRIEEFKNNNFNTVIFDFAQYDFAHYKGDEYITPNAFMSRVIDLLESHDVIPAFGPRSIQNRYIQFCIYRGSYKGDPIYYCIPHDDTDCVH